MIINLIKLSAGTALPGIVAAKCGCNVTLSDREGSPRLQENMRQTCKVNGVQIKRWEAGGPVSTDDDGRGGGVSSIMALSWGVFSPSVLELCPQDIILASDCFYDSKGIERPILRGLETKVKGA